MPRELRQPGTYLLLFELRETAQIQVGRLGLFRFPAGWYVYVGSALGGLGPRLRRHLRQAKPYHWQVDALREVADLVAVSYRIGRERLECAVAAALLARAGASRPVPRFGASDCRCPAHLIRFDEPPDLRIATDWLVRTISPDQGGR